MSDLKTLVTDLKNFLFNNQPAPAAPVAPVAAAATTAKLKDGTEVSISALEVGGTVMIGDAPAPAGEHELEDGSKVTVGEGGVITALAPAEMPEEPATDYNKEFAAVNEKLSGYEQRFATYEQKFADYETRIQKAQAMNEKLFAIVEKLAEAPTADPASTSGSNFQSQISKDKEARLKELQANIQKLKTA